MKRNRPPLAEGQAARVSKASKRTFILTRDASPDNSPPIEVHFLADDVIVWHEVPAIELLCGHAQGPGRLGDLMRAARPP
jgi:hypothetical protein